VDPHELNKLALLRRALQAQVDMGLGRIVVSRERLEESRAAFQAGVERTRQISVQQALDGGLQDSGGTQTAMSIDQDPQFESPDAHNTAICECQNCPLGATRTKFVYGVGNPNADLMFVGEAPGADEDRQGEPFVGRAGQLLDKIIAAMGLSRDQVYIANILKCRPPGNRDPQPDEIAKCIPYLREQIRLIRPKVMCALGRIAGQALLNTSSPLGKLRGEWHQFEGTDLLVTYHPAALLRFAQYKKPTWADMQLIMARLNLNK
jgi:DNA polymerase